MKDSPITRMSNKETRGHTADLLRSKLKLKFHQLDTTFKFKTVILQILQIRIYFEVFNTISISNLHGRPFHSSTAKTGGLHTQIVRIPSRDGDPSYPLQH